MRMTASAVAAGMVLACLPMAAQSLSQLSVEPNPIALYQPYAVTSQEGSIPVNNILQTFSSPIALQVDPSHDPFGLNLPGTYSFSKIWAASQVNFEDFMESMIGQGSGDALQALTVQRNYPALTNPFSLQAYDPDAPIGTSLNQPQIQQWSLTLINGVPYVVEGVQILFASSSPLYPGDIVPAKAGI